MAEKVAPTHSWLMERRYFPLIMVVVFVLLSAIAFYICYRHYTISTEKTLKEDRSTAGLLSLVLDEHLKKIVGIMESYSNQPPLIQAVKDKNVEKASQILITLVKNNPDMDFVVLSDRWGTPWAASYAPSPVLGKNFAHRDWYKGVSKEWKPFISDVVLRVVAEKDLAIQISIPCINEKGEVIGILVNTQRTVGLNRLFTQVPLDPGQSITVTDRKGQIVSGSRHDIEKEIRPYPFQTGIDKAKAAKKKTFAVDDPDLGRKTRYISFSPAPNIGWTVFVDRGKRSIFLSEIGYYFQVTAIACLLFLSIILIFAYLKKQVMAQQLQGQLKAEEKIRAGEENLRALSSRQKAILAAVPDIIMEVDSNKIYSWTNQAGFEFFGEKVIGQEAAFYFEGEQETYHTVQPLFEGSENIIYVESWQRRKDGEKRLLAWWCRVLKDEKGKVIGALSSARDITERKQAEEEIRKLNADLEQRVIKRTAQFEASNKELEAFAYSVSHDLRAPLRAVDGFSRILQEEWWDKLDDEGRRLLDIIRINTQHMDQLIVDLLLLSRVTRTEIQTSRIDMTLLANSIYREIASPETQKKFSFSIGPLPDAEGDPTLMKQVWVNLLGNALKYSLPKDEYKIEIGGQREEGMNIYHVKDNGVGFNPEYTHKLFGVFHRLHKAEDFEGTGIGLAIVQRIIHRHGGQVWAEGKVGEGATFWFSIPA
jgi:PAS domain S-box-containing protein